MIADDILHKAKEVITLDPTELSGELRAYDDILEQLLQKRLEPADFIRKWDKIGWKPSPQKIEPAAPEPKPPEPAKPGPRLREPKIPEPRKMSRTLKFGALAGFAVLLLIVGWWYISQQPEEEYTNSIGMKFVLIPAGTFMMGSPPDEPERDDDEEQHKVTITKSFYLQTTQVTQGQWKKVMRKNPSEFKDCGDECPVEEVSWNHAQDFIKKLNDMENTKKYRLPTEAEWEYACRAGTTTAFHTGESISTDQANYDGNYPMPGSPKGEYRGRTVKIGSFPPEAWGLYDMHGNVWEWCQDWYGDYPKGDVRDPEGPSAGEYRVLRGGSWDGGARGTRSANRNRDAPDFRDYNIGFRVARDL